MNNKIIFIGALVALVAVASLPAASATSGVRGRGRQLYKNHANGEACKSDAHCRSGACAQGQKDVYVCCTGKKNYDRLWTLTNWCIKQPNGGACWDNDDRQCASGNCEGTVCQAKREAQSECNPSRGDTQCKSKTCAVGYNNKNICCPSELTIDGRCRQQPLHARCDLNLQCNSGKCDKSRKRCEPAGGHVTKPSCTETLITKPAAGKWVMTLPDVTAGADSVSFSTGTTRSYSTTTTETWGKSATASVSAGFTAFGANITASVSGTLSETMAESSASSFSQTTTETRTTKFTEIGVGWQWQFDITDDCGTSTTLSPGFPIVTPSSDKPPCCLPGQFLVDESNNKRDDFNCIAGAVNLCTGDNTACKLWDKDGNYWMCSASTADNVIEPGTPCTGGTWEQC